MKLILGLCFGIIVGTVIGLGSLGFLPTRVNFLSLIIVIASLILSLQGIFTLVWMLYAWENPKEVDFYKSPKKYFSPVNSFTALIPARHEELVIQDTIRAVNNIDYPDRLKEVIVLCKEDDTGTIEKVLEVIEEIGKKNIKLKVFDTLPINKPHGLNIGLKEAKKNIVTIFDAEDEPHKDIYKIVNTVLLRDKVDVVQSGVQLMNYRTNWFSSINVLEYFFWFKSGLHFFSRIGNVTPLGGNTVFVKRSFLNKVGGWDETCLTEDADVGIRLVKSGAKTRIVYDEEHVTQEETPKSVQEFIKQRTRWSHGFLQILLKRDWEKLPQLRQKLVSLYILLTPIMQTCFLFYLPFGVWSALNYKLPVLISMISFIPMYIFILQVGVSVVGIREFAKLYGIKYSFFDSIKIMFVYIPYQIMLTISAFRAVFRLLCNDNCWEKTSHANVHREGVKDISPSFAYAR